MKKLNPKEILKPIVVLLVICVAVTAVLAVVNGVTAEPIAKLAEEQAAETRSVVLPSAEEYQKLELDNEDIFECYEGLKNGEVVGYTFTSSASGYGGTIEVMTGIDCTTGEISGVSILSQDETPGLGANATKSEFTDQYKQKAQELEVIKNAEPADGEIQAITGSTITSQAVTDAVNKAVAAYEKIDKEGE